MAAGKSPIFLPGDYLPILQPSVGTAAETAAAALASATAAAASAQTFDWSAIHLNPTGSTDTDHQQVQESGVEVEGAGPCAKARTTSLLMTRHVLPPHGPTYVCSSSNNRYTPRVGDIVVGIISSKGSEYYGVRTYSSFLFISLLEMPVHCRSCQFVIGVPRTRSLILLLFCVAHAPAL